MDHKFQTVPLNIIPLVEKMWDIQERDGHCEVRTGQTLNPWKKEEKGDDDVQAWRCLSRF